MSWNVPYRERYKPASKKSYLHPLVTGLFWAIGISTFAFIIFAFWVFLTVVEAHASPTVLATSYNDEWDATGRKLDPAKLTAAHKTHPLGSIWTLRCPASRRAIVVMVNDRGPFIVGREWDLTPGADQALRCHGLCRVKAEPWPPLPKPRP